MKQLIALLIVGLVITSCDINKKSNYSNTAEVELKTSEAVVAHPGKLLMQNKCYLCHNPNTDHKGRIAPPMVAVKSHYLDDDTTKEEFSNAIWEFVQKPSIDKTKMRGAVRRFGLMPYQEFKEEEIRQIAEYMYDYKIDEPEWFKQHIEEESKGKMQYRNDGKKADESPSEESKKPEDKGLQYALNTKKELGKNLMSTIQKKGTLEAVSFCNKKAYPITDSMANVQNARIRRVSNKPRNPENQATKKELGIIENFKRAVANNHDYQAVTEVIDNKVHFYYPITTNSMCLQCHGKTNADIEPEVLQTILSLYPNDKATGYDVNEVRGIWSITYDQ